MDVRNSSYIAGVNKRITDCSGTREGEREREEDPTLKITNAGLEVRLEV
jgi:hypothetical protein